MPQHTLDGDHHGPMGLRLLENMECGGDSLKESEVLQQAENSILERIRLWDGVLEALPEHAAMH